MSAAAAPSRASPGRAAVAGAGSMGGCAVGGARMTTARSAFTAGDCCPGLTRAARAALRLTGAAAASVCAAVAGADRGCSGAGGVAAAGSDTSVLNTRWKSAAGLVAEAISRAALHKALRFARMLRRGNDAVGIHIGMRLVVVPVRIYRDRARGGVERRYAL